VRHRFAGKSRAEEIELLALNEGDIRVAEMITEDLPKSALAGKFHEAIKHARERFDGDAKIKLIAQDP